MASHINGAIFRVCFLYSFCACLQVYCVSLTSNTVENRGTRNLYKATQDERRDRVRRQLHVMDYAIEVLMVADFSVYSFWFDRTVGHTESERHIQAEKDLRQFYALLFDATDLRFDSVVGRGFNIRLLFAGLHIAKNITDAPWTEKYRNVSVSPNYVSAVPAVIDFQKWVNDHSNDLPDHGHAMLFTRYDLERNGQTATIGLSYMGGLCLANRVSIVKDTFHAYTATYAAQQLGFNLNAKQDGNGNTCEVGAGFVMEGRSGVSLNSKKNRRLWKFSNCSMDYFDLFIAFLDRTQRNCMVSRSTMYNPDALEEYEDNLLGQLYPPDNQCQAIDGPTSYLCREFLDSDYSTICELMPCSLLENNGSCWLRVPWEGTSCGNGKVCIKGYCVPHQLAPSGLTETCLFGDQPGYVANKNKTCEELILLEDQLFLCYDYAEQCCKTCATVEALFGNLTGCEFGDKKHSCVIDDCSYENTTELCCYTCAEYINQTKQTNTFSSRTTDVSLATDIRETALENQTRYLTQNGRNDTTLPYFNRSTDELPQSIIQSYTTTERLFSISKEEILATFRSNSPSTDSSQIISATEEITHTKISSPSSPKQYTTFKRASSSLHKRLLATETLSILSSQTSKYVTDLLTSDIVHTSLQPNLSTYRTTKFRPSSTPKSSNATTEYLQAETSYTSALRQQSENIAMLSTHIPKHAITTPRTAKSSLLRLLTNTNRILADASASINLTRTAGTTIATPHHIVANKSIFATINFVSTGTSSKARRLNFTFLTRSVSSQSSTSVLRSTRNQTVSIRTFTGENGESTPVVNSTSLETSKYVPLHTTFVHTDKISSERPNKTLLPTVVQHLQPKVYGHRPKCAAAVKYSSSSYVLFLSVLSVSL